MQQTVITCMETLNKNVDGERAVSSLVIGTESRQVLVLDPPGNSILAKVTLPGVPVNLGVTGLHDVDYRIVVACRDGNIYTIKVPHHVLLCACACVCVRVCACACTLQHRVTRARAERRARVDKD